MAEERQFEDQGGSSLLTDVYNLDQATLAQVDEIQKQVASNSELVGKLEELTSLEKEYSEDDLIYQAKIQDLKSKYCKIRRTRGDGNCFFRAFTFAYMENLVKDPSDLERDRYEEMLQFVPHIHKFLERQNVRHEIFVINQADKHRFNRAALLNIGFLLSRKDCDYMVMHDVDLLPLNDDLRYSYPYKGPLHIASPELHPLYHYATFVGGILIMSRTQFEQVDGLSNLFWGWGREDDELYVRMKEKGMKVQYPQGIKTGTGTFKHLHDRKQRPRDQKKYLNQKEMSRKRDRRTGVSTVAYSVVSDVGMVIDDAPLHFVSVDLVCDYELTPFCDTPS